MFDQNNEDEGILNGLFLNLDYKEKDFIFCIPNYSPVKQSLLCLTSACVSIYMLMNEFIEDF